MEIAVSVPPELDAFIREHIENTECETPAQVVWEALWLLRDVCEGRSTRWEALRAAIAVGIEQADRGETRPFDAEAIKAEGRRRLAERRKSD
jgi:antitoxin ParD1/3/4